MSSEKTKGIVLGGVDVKEKDKLIYIFTPDLGVITASLKGVRAEKAKLKSAKSPFSFGEFILEGASPKIVTGFDMIDNFYSLSKDIDKYYEGCALLDIVKNVGGEPSPAIFIELIKALKTLCYDSPRKYYCLIKFLYFLFDRLGYGFLRDKCSRCGEDLMSKYFNFQFGELVCPSCKDYLSSGVSENCYSAIKLISSTPYEKLKTVKIGGSGASEALALLSKNYEFRFNAKIISF